MTETGTTETTTSPAAAQPDEPAVRPAVRAAAVNPYLAAVAAWLVPGAGHLLLRRFGRGVLFLVLVVAAAVIGCALDGNLHRVLPGQPLTYLATVGSMGMGIPYFVLRYFLGYQGDPVSIGYEYGTAFLLTAGLMNLLLVLDAWDIALGKKE